MRPKYWVVVTSRNHALLGAQAGIAQVNHGKQAPLKRMTAGDQVLVYAPKQVYRGNEPCQRFVALASLPDNAIYQTEVSPGFKPFRRKAHYQEVDEAEIKNILRDLEFIKNKKNWGYSFRFGCFEINQHDFELIRSCMLKSDEG
jgi:hypothetical protein